MGAYRNLGADDLGAPPANFALLAAAGMVLMGALSMLRQSPKRATAAIFRRKKKRK